MKTSTLTDCLSPWCTSNIYCFNLSWIKLNITVVSVNGAGGQPPYLPLSRLGTASLHD